MPLEIFLLGKKTMTYPTMPYKLRPLIYVHTALVLPDQSPTLLYDTGISQPMICIIARLCIAVK